MKKVKFLSGHDAGNDVHYYQGDCLILDDYLADMLLSHGVIEILPEKEVADKQYENTEKADKKRKSKKAIKYAKGKETADKKFNY